MVGVWAPNSPFKLVDPKQHRALYGRFLIVSLQLVFTRWSSFNCVVSSSKVLSRITFKVRVKISTFGRGGKMDHTNTIVLDTANNYRRRHNPLEVDMANGKHNPPLRKLVETISHKLHAFN